MRRILEKAWKDGSLVCVYTDTNYPNYFWYGRIIGIDKDHFVLDVISSGGEYDGYKILPIEKVFLVNQGDRTYDETIAILMKYSGYVEERTPIDADDVIRWGLQSAMDNGWGITISLLDMEEDDIIGTVMSIEKGFCQVQRYDSYGEERGIDYFDIDDISMIRIDSKTERKALLLAREKRTRKQ